MINGQMWALVVWGGTTVWVVGGGGSSTDWGDWVDLSGISLPIPYSQTTMIPGGGFSPTIGQAPLVLANNGQPNKSGCDLALLQGAVSVGLDVLGAIPAFGNIVSASAAGARVANGIVAYGGAAYGIGTGLTDESPVGAASAGAGLGLTLADAALEGGKVIPGLGNFLSVATGLYDAYQLGKTIQRCW